MEGVQIVSNKYMISVGGQRAVETSKFRHLPFKVKARELLLKVQKSRFGRCIAESNLNTRAADYKRFDLLSQSDGPAQDSPRE